ncbi:MAG: hypothetical protein J7M26_05185 [Armatimonadetes bacterium]|nr:hypothetical protein [Armatimonadota bacterium]
MSEAAAPGAATRGTTRPQPLWLPGPVVWGAAAVAAIILSRGKLTDIALPAFAFYAILVALGPPVPAMVMLIVVSSLDGIFKGVATGWFTLLFKDVILWLAVLRWAALRKHGQYAEVPRVTVVAIMAAFVLWVCAEGINVFTLSWLVALAGIRAWAGWMPTFFVAYEGIRKRRDVAVLWLTLVFAAGLTGAYGTVQQAIGYDHLLRVSPAFAYVEHTKLSGGATYRAMSTLPYPGMFGHYMATVLPLGLAFFLAPLLPLRLRWLSALAVLGMAGGALASGGRLAAASAMTCALLFLLLSRQARVVFVGLLVAVLLTSVAVKLVAPTAVTRVSHVFDMAVTLDRVIHPFRQGFRAISEHPLGTGVATGVGLGRAARLLGTRVKIEQEAGGMIEGDFGRAFRELGLPGGFLFLCLVGHVLSRGMAVHRRMRHPGWRVVSAALVAVLISEALGLLVGPAFYLMPVAALFWLAYASLLRLEQITHQREQEAAGEGGTPALGTPTPVAAD